MFVFDGKWKVKYRRSFEGSELYVHGFVRKNSKLIEPLKLSSQKNANFMQNPQFILKKNLKPEHEKLFMRN